MKLETSEADREWVRKRVDYIRSQGGPFILDDRVYCDFLTLLAEVERLRAEYEHNPPQQVRALVCDP